MKSLRLHFTALALLVAFAFGPLGAPPAGAQQVIYCINSTSTPCISAHQVGSGTQGDPGWLFSGKVNENFAALPSELFSTHVLLPAHGGSGVATITGLLKGNGTSAFSVAAASDVIPLWSGTCSVSTFLRGDGSCQTPSGGGNVSNSGTPTAHQTGVWLSATTIEGVGPGTTGQAFASTGASTDPAFASSLSGVTSVNGSTVPSSTTLAGLTIAETYSALQTFGNSDIALLGSSTGATTFTSANASASNFTLTLPAITDTLVTLTATQTLTNKSIAASEVNSGTLGGGQMPALTGDVTSSAGTVATTVGKINGTSLAGLATGLLKNTTSTGAPSIATSADVIADFSGTCSSSTFLRGDGSCQTPAGGGSVTTTGTPASGNLSKFSGSTSVTNGDLSGDVTTSGTLATTVGKINGTSLAGLATGLLKNTTSTGVPSIATSADVISDFSGTCSSTTFLRGDGACQTPVASATSITPGTTTVLGATAPCLIDNSASTTMGCAALAQTLALNSGTLGTVAPNRTVTTSPTVASTDMGGVIYSNVTGGGTITIPAISSTVFASGQTATFVNYSASTAAISTTPTVNAGGGCVSGTGIPAGVTWELVSNGTTLDCNQTVSSASGGASSFSGLTSGTNTGMAGVVGTGASLTFSGTGTINAGQVNGAGVPSSVLMVATNGSGQIISKSVVTDSPAAGPLNDYDPSGFSGFTGVMYLTPSSGGTTLNGLVGFASLQELYIVNAEAAGGADLIKLVNQSASETTAANRFLTSATSSLAIPPGGRVLCINLPSPASRWQCQ